MGRNTLNQTAVTLNEKQSIIGFNGILRVFEYTLEDKKALHLEKSTTTKRQNFILSSAKDFERKDFKVAKEGEKTLNVFNGEEKEVFKLLGIQTFEPKKKASKKSDRYTRNKALKDALLTLIEPTSKQTIIETSDKLYREKNPDTKAPAYTKELKNAPAEFHFRYGFDLMLEMGHAEQTGTSEKALYSLVTVKS